MKTYRAEFPVRNTISASEFLKCAVHWVEGITSSKLNFSHVDEEDENSVYALSEDMNEEFKCIRVPDKKFPKFGFSYRVRKPEGLVYETEVCYSSDSAVGIVALRASCVTLDPKVFAHTPLKPAVIKLALERGWIDEDNELHAQLRHREVTLTDQLDRLLDIGDSSGLPWIALLADERGRYPCSPSKVANDFCGLAQTYVIRNNLLIERFLDAFDESSSSHLCVLSIPNTNSFEFIRGDQDATIDALKRLLVGFNANADTRRGLEWSDLLELQLKFVRQQSVLSSTDMPSGKLTNELSLRQQIVEEKQHKIDELQQRLDQQNSDLKSSIKVNSPLELFEGEFLERIGKHLERSLSDPYLSERTKLAISAALQSLPAKSVMKEFVRKLKGCKDPDSLVWFLEQIGYSHSQDGKHHKLIPAKDQRGIDQVTLAKTPSDRRAHDNAISQVRKALDLDI
ncbi:hypothetical protein [Hyphomonas sp.]|uniref:hypothetical protein n=1 Tax=Hyphomonas sp. TaxID=87 RepID=UPI00391A4108